MDSRLFFISTHFYQALLRAYPPRFRQRFQREMGQVFRTSLHQAQRARGTNGILCLWLPTLWDWAITAVREQVSALLGKDLYMNDTNAFDRQLGDAIWMMATGFFAGYSKEQACEALAIETPEPVRSAFKQVVADLQDGVDFYTAFANLQKTIPSRLLARVVAVLEEQRITDGNLGMILEPLSEQFVQEVGSDPASHEAMRRCAEQLGAPLPERAK